MPLARWWRGLAGLLLCLSALASLPLAAQPASVISTSTPAPASDPLVSATLTPERVAPGERAQLRITVLVPTFMPQPVAFPRFDQPNLRIELPSRATMPISQAVEGRTWSGVSRRYAVTPLAAGEFRLGPGTLEITYQDPEAGDTVTRTAPLAAQTLVVTVPQAAAGLSPYVAGTALTLEQRITVTRAEDAGEAAGETSVLKRPEEPVLLTVGDSLQRELVVTLEGGSPLLLPSLIDATPLPTMAVHAASPTLTETANGGTRTERLTYIAQHGGPVTLPAIRLDWYDLAHQRIDSASLPALSLDVSGGAGAAASLRARAATQGPAALAVVLIGVLLIVMGGVLFRRWGRSAWQRWRQHRRERRTQDGRAVLVQFERAVRARQLADSLSAWQALQARVPGLETVHRQEIERLLAMLGQQRYGVTGQSAMPSASTPDTWAALQRALPRAADLRQARLGPCLPPLNPRAS
ncbi:BatD family protein [Salinicola rhizosphaerae]|uniref:BatD family protein n=1 Tax=Salinicola rhizosphaerae TaxID=1443141 RepID=UPI0016748FAB|nr:BatD family protein [Salinicola rhizosphaerae]